MSITSTNDDATEEAEDTIGGKIATESKAANTTNAVADLVVILIFLFHKKDAQLHNSWCSKNSKLK